MTVSLRGSHALANIVSACRWCNEGRAGLPFGVWLDDCRAGRLDVQADVFAL